MPRHDAVPFVSRTAATRDSRLVTVNNAGEAHGGASLRAIYQIDPYLFRDSGRGWGTLDGITEKLDYLQWLGISHVWLLPFYCNAGRDGGYDVTDHYRIDPRLGDQAAFQRLVDAANARGIGIIVELVMQHTASAHRGSSPRSRVTRPGAAGTCGATTCLTTACSRCSRRSRPLSGHGMPRPARSPAHVLPARARPRPGPCAGTRGTAAGNDVLAAARRGRLPRRRGPVHGRARPPRGPARRRAVAAGGDARHGRRTAARAAVDRQADVRASRYGDFLCQGRRLSHLLDFHLNNHFFLALARGDASEVARVMAEYGPHAPPDTRIAWLRNNDELDLEQLEPDEREAVMERFAPERGMRIYGRGIRRRLAPMLDGAIAWQAMAWAALLSLGRVPVVRYGEEIGLGDCLELPERNAVRMPMHWHGGPGLGSPTNRGMPGARTGGRPLRLPHGECRGATRDAGSLLLRVRELLQQRNAHPVLQQGPHARPTLTALLMLRFGEAPHQALALINFGDNPVEVDVPLHGPLHTLVGHGINCRVAAATCRAMAIRGWLPRVPECAAQAVRVRRSRR